MPVYGVCPKVVSCSSSFFWELGAIHLLWQLAILVSIGMIQSWLTWNLFFFPEKNNLWLHTVSVSPPMLSYSLEEDYARICQNPCLWLFLHAGVTMHSPGSSPWPGFSARTRQESSRPLGSSSISSLATSVWFLMPSSFSLVPRGMPSPKHRH